MGTRASIVAPGPAMVRYGATRRASSSAPQRRSHRRRLRHEHGWSAVADEGGRSDTAHTRAPLRRCRSLGLPVPNHSCPIALPMEPAPRHADTDADLARSPCRGGRDSVPSFGTRRTRRRVHGLHCARAAFGHRQHVGCTFRVIGHGVEEVHDDVRNAARRRCRCDPEAPRRHPRPTFMGRSS